MKCVAFLLLLLLGLPAAVLCNHPFRATLYDMNGEFYELLWNFSVEDETIEFAVNVSTTGWVGFGLSPNGDMTRSDVVIGWVDDSGTAFFHDRFADGRARPPIDEQQDWELTEGREEGGFTTLYFTRPWITCDERDRDILPQTTRVVFSWNEADPPNNDPDQVAQHSVRSSASLNLLGGNPQAPPEPEDRDSFFIGANNVVIPSASTTYWCVATRLASRVFERPNYIYRYSPEIVPGNTAFVHHIIVYQCEGLNVTEDTSAVCEGEQAVDTVTECTRGQGVVIAGWAIGGGDFAYPQGVAQQFTGRASDGQFSVIEIHYDNPNNVENVRDSSGIRFFYTGNTPEQNAGIFTVGAPVSQLVIIPPNAPNFTVSVHCPARCLQNFIPDEGITIFANTFHTHLAGHGLALEHYRTAECGVLEEVEPVERNLFYDFNFQQQNTLPRQTKIFPGDVLVLKCFYDTTGREGVTLGGEATQDEMCFAFVNYYPVRDDVLAVCTNVVTEYSYDPFVERYVPDSLKQNFTDYRNDYVNNLEGFEEPSFSVDDVKRLFNSLDWTNQTIQEGFQKSTVYSDTASVYDVCLPRVPQNAEDIYVGFSSALPAAQCTYQEPNVCTNFAAVPCCERLGAPGLVMSFMLTLSMLMLAVISLL